MSPGNKSTPDKQIKIEMSFLVCLGKEGGSAQLLQLQGPTATCSAVFIQCSKQGFLIMRSIGCFPAPLSPDPSLSFAPIHPAQSELDSQQFPLGAGLCQEKSLIWLVSQVHKPRLLQKHPSLSQFLCSFLVLAASFTFAHHAFQ